MLNIKKKSCYIYKIFIKCVKYQKILKQNLFPKKIINIEKCDVGNIFMKRVEELLEIAATQAG